MMTMRTWMLKSADCALRIVCLSILLMKKIQLTFAVFNPTPHPPIAPWHHNFAAPTPPYENQQACPIDWSKVEIKHPNVEYKRLCRQAYELRRPWDKQPVAWEKVAENIGLLSAEDGKKRTVSQEGGRKRFMAANKAIFKLTGVYFPESSLGLKDYDVPLHNELNPILKGLGQARAAKKRIVACNPLEYGGEDVQLVVFPPGRKGGINRFITKEVMDRLSVQEQHFFRYSLDSFDRWYTSVFRGLRHTLPRRLYCLEPWNGDSYMHLDNGTPSITMSGLFETYRLSQEVGTTGVSDMILDEIIQSFRRENELANRHEEDRVTMQDCDKTVRTLSFDVDDINLLWEHTEQDDPIRKLVLEILYRWKDTVEDTIEEQRRMLDADFTKEWKACINGPGFKQCNVLEKFFHEGRKFRPMDPKEIVAPGRARYENLGQENGSLQDFCAKYHNHVGYGSECFRSRPESPRLIPENFNDSKIVKVLFKDVEYKIEDRASHDAFTFDFERMVIEKPDWDWPRVRSVDAYVKGPLNLRSGKRSYYLNPAYYEIDTLDENGRYPSHPGYQLTDWTPPDLDFEHFNVYEEPWEKVMKRDIPMSATNHREEKIRIGEDDEGEPIYQITAIFFEIEDPNWCPPNDWEPYIHSSSLSPQEVRDYRRWLWVKEGGEIPRIEVERFRPFKDGTPAWTDPFVDLKKKVSVLDILR